MLGYLYNCCSSWLNRDRLHIVHFSKWNYKCHKILYYVFGRISPEISCCALCVFSFILHNFTRTHSLSPVRSFYITFTFFIIYLKKSYAITYKKNLFINCLFYLDYKRRKVFQIIFHGFIIS